MQDFSIGTLRVKGFKGVFTKDLNQTLYEFDAVALTVAEAAEAVLDDTLDPLAMGVSGSCGSGKATILRLVRAALKECNLGPDKQILIVDTDPWRYDPSVGAKESLIGEVRRSAANYNKFRSSMRPRTQLSLAPSGSLPFTTALR